MGYLCRFFALVLWVLPATASAYTVVHVCDTQTNRQRGFIPDKLVIAHDVGAARVFVSDLLIQSITGGPLAGEVVSDNATRTVFRWTLPNVPNSSGQVASLSYRATLFKATGRIDISMRPLNRSTTFSATGTCRRA